MSERMDLTEAVKGDRRQQLEAIRDYIANELEVNRCASCTGSKLRTGDQASLILRLQTVTAELEALPTGEEENRLGNIIRSLRVVGSSDSEPGAHPSPDEQHRTGSRRAGGGRRPGT